jgi:hypothetical protein
VRLGAALLLLGLSGAVAAESCPALEFAELNAMPNTELQALRCQYAQERLATLNARDIAISNRCASEGARIDRVLARRYHLPADPAEHRATILKKCATQ